MSTQPTGSNATHATPGPADTMRPESLAFLKELLDTPSPSGFERDGQRVWLAYARRFASKTWNDPYNNCFASFGPEGDGIPTLAVCGHADEIGLMVNHFDEKGFIYCKAIGGIDTGSIVGKRVQFRSSIPGVKNPVVGLIGATAIHLQDKSVEGKVRKMHELFIDIGAANGDEAKQRLAIGDAGVFLDGFMHLSDDLVVARALDNRIGTWIAAEALRLVAERAKELKVRVVAVSTVQEEVGLRGAQMIARTLAPSVALVTDVGHATDSPGISHAQHGLFKLAGGPKIAVGGAMQPEVVARLAEVAAGLSIPLQRAATPGGSGTDTDAIFVQGGIPCGLVSLPIRYMHTTVEMTSLRDLNRIAHLFAGFALSMKPGEQFTGVL
ncbi:MAG: M20/M25/M40 family metallo-hydrolase [Planctomycetaceae bacterium]|nr:M20/M25/M40 family metallo-hydrolase [Planctomycetaceae bacterium]